MGDMADLIADYGYDGPGIYREDEWLMGYHTDKQGNTHNLKDMTIEHLRNTIKYFSHLDTSPLQIELNKRLTKNIG